MLSLLLLGATTTTALAASKLQARAEDCTTFPSWTVQDFRSNATDAVGSGGVASFTIINNLSGAVDELRCDLQVNYRCIIAGTPSDANLTVHVAVRAQSLILGFDKVVVECPGRTTPLHIIGEGDLNLNCTWNNVLPAQVLCSLAKETVQGAAVELAPETTYVSMATATPAS